MTAFFLKLYRANAKFPLDPGYPSDYSFLDTCIIVGYCLTIFTVLPVFVLVAWGVDAIHDL